MFMMKETQAERKRRITRALRGRHTSHANWRLPRKERFWLRYGMSPKQWLRQQRRNSKRNLLDQRSRY